MVVALLGCGNNRYKRNYVMNWAGQPLRSTMLAYINGTTTSTGLTVTSRLNEKKYVKGKKYLIKK